MKRIFLTLTLLMLPYTQSFAKVFDWSHFQSILDANLSVGTINQINAALLNYPAIKQDQDFYKIAEKLASYNPEALPPKEKLAFYINAYNYYAIKVVTDHWPVKSIRDIGSFLSPVWKKTVGKINGKNISLDKIEHVILRNMGEPRIHFAIVCASLSCPNLASKIYTSNNLDEQLEKQTHLFLKDKSKGAVVTNETLYISKIFDWFDEDFDTHGGVLDFISTYRPEFKRFTGYKLLDYDWTLNRSH